MRLAALVVVVLACGDAFAQATVPGKGNGDVTATWQEVTDHYHLDWRGRHGSAGHITTHSLQLRLDYGLTDRLALTLTAPYVMKKYVGDFPHNPDSIPDGHDRAEVIDDGEFRSTWQDPGVGLRWQWKQRPWLVTPFANYSWPSHDYTYFAHSAPGTHQKRLALGVAAARQFGPRLPKLYFQGSYSYTFVEEVEDVSVDYSTLNAELGWFFSPRFSARAFATYRKTHGGLDFPIDFPPPRNTEFFFHHDQIQRVDYLNAGFGASWRVNDRWFVNGNWMTTVWGENGHAIHNAVSIGVSRSFR